MADMSRAIRLTLMTRSQLLRELRDYQLAAAAEAAAGDEAREGLAQLRDRPALERRIVGALKSAVDAHGPVTRENTSHAAKRVASAVLAAARGEQ